MKQIAPLLIAGIALLMSARSASADTILTGGNLVGASLWTPAGSPYVVQGDLTIPTGSTLTIQAGVQVLFTATDSQSGGLNSGKTEIHVAGSLIVQGTDASLVTFEAQTGAAPGTWYGIVVEPAAAAATIQGARIRHGIVGITGNVAGSVLQISQSSFANTSLGGVSIGAGTPGLDRVRFDSCGDYGLQSVSSGAPTVTNGIFVSNTSGVKCSATTGATFVEQCTFYANTNGLYADGPIGTTLGLFDTILSQNAVGILHVGTGTAASYNHCDFHGNTTADISGVVTGGGSIYQDPRFVSPPADFRLLPGSPCIDAGLGVSSSHDFLGNPRPIDGSGDTSAEYDIGALEALANVAPVLADPGNQSVNEGSLLALTLTASEANGEPVTYSSATLPPGATLDANTGAFAWTPDSDDSLASPYAVTFIASDGLLTHSRTIQITVADTLTASAAPSGGGGGGGGCGLTGIELLALLALRRRR